MTAPTFIDVWASHNSEKEKQKGNNSSSRVASNFFGRFSSSIIIERRSGWQCNDGFWQRTSFKASDGEHGPSQLTCCHVSHPNLFCQSRGKNSPSTLTIKDGRSLERILSLTNLCISECSMMAWKHFFSLLSMLSLSDMCRCKS